MKRKLTLSFVVAAVFGVYVAAIWRLPKLINVTGNNVLILRIGLGVLGLIVAMVVLMYLLRKPAPPPPPKDAIVEELQKALLAAEKKLAVAKVAPAGALGKLPVVLVLGPAGSTKTSSVVRSGLDVELLVGDVFREDAIVATRGANLWFGRNTLFMEAGRDIADDAGRWKWLLYRLQPARLRGALSSGEQAPRVAVVCYSCEGLTAAGAAESAAVAARALREKLGQLSQMFGIRLPVYVLFSKADRVPGFAEYVQNFTKDEGRVVVGATLPLATRGDGASHADRESRRLNDAWARLFSGLAARRLDVLARESTGERKPAAYEFPREVRKIAPAAVQFLVELCRPSELGIGPVLRGFYLTGVRAVVTSDGAAAIPSLMQAREPQAAVAATSVFRPVAGTAAAAPMAPATGGRKKPEWVFLSGVFQDVILADSVAMGVTRGGARISALRRTLAAVGIGLAAMLVIGFTWSFFGNLSLRRSVRQAAAAASALPAATVAKPSVEQLARLDSLREQVDVLSENYHEGAPFWLRWGLYSGNRLYGPARALYFDKAAKLIYDSTRASLKRATASLATPNAAVPYDSAYRLLKAYLVTNEEFAHSTEEFLGPVLASAWPQSATADSSARELARKQFDFFGKELVWGNPYGDKQEGAIVGGARNVLRNSSGINPIYQSMLGATARHGQSVRLGAVRAGALVNRVEVPAQFTRTAWPFFVDTALGPNLSQFLQGEPWVTGGSVTLPGSAQELAQQLRARYVADYVSAWRAFVRGASVPAFGGLPDAMGKLDALSSPSSPLLAMLLTVSQHAAVDSVVSRQLQPVDVVMPLKNSQTFVGGDNQPYMDALGGLANAVRQAVNTAASGGTAPLEQAAGAVGPARDAVRKLSSKFAQEPESLLGLENLLLSPVLGSERLITNALGGKKLEGEALDINAQAVTFCEDIRPVLDKYPFVMSARAKATNADLARVFRPAGGRVAQFYEQFLRGKVLTWNGSQFRPVSGGPAPTDQLVQFLTRSRRITDALFTGGASEPRAQFTLRPQVNDATPITVTFGDEAFNATKGSERSVTATWRFGDSASVGFSRQGSNSASDVGAWAPFKIYWEEARRAGPNGGRMYDIVLSSAIRGAVEIGVVGGVLSDPSVFSLPTCPTSAVK